MSLCSVCPVILGSSRRAQLQPRVYVPVAGSGASTDNLYRPASRPRWQERPRTVQGVPHDAFLPCILQHFRDNVGAWTPPPLPSLSDTSVTAAIQEPRTARHAFSFAISLGPRHGVLAAVQADVILDDAERDERPAAAVTAVLPYYWRTEPFFQEQVPVMVRSPPQTRTCI